MLYRRIGLACVCVCASLLASTEQPKWLAIIWVSAISRLAGHSKMQFWIHNKKDGFFLHNFLSCQTFWCWSSWKLKIDGQNVCTSTGALFSLNDTAFFCLVQLIIIYWSYRTQCLAQHLEYLLTLHSSLHFSLGILSVLHSSGTLWHNMSV